MPRSSQWYRVLSWSSRQSTGFGAGAGPGESHAPEWWMLISTLKLKMWSGGARCVGTMDTSGTGKALSGICATLEASRTEASPAGRMGQGATSGSGARALFGKTATMPPPASAVTFAALSGVQRSEHGTGRRSASPGKNGVMVAVGRFRGCVAGTGDAFVLREKQEGYGRNFSPENRPIGSNNTCFRSDFP